MATQNLVSATLSAETRKSILGMLAEIRKNMDFLITLKSNQVQSLFKLRNSYAPFVEMAYNVMNEHPEIMSNIFEQDEFRKDFELSKDLALIVDAVRQLCDTLLDTQMAVNSDAINNALEVYTAVKQNRGRLPGLNDVYAQMSQFFKRARKAVKAVRSIETAA